MTNINKTFFGPIVDSELRESYHHYAFTGKTRDWSNNT
jgi:hypothetical protein